MTKRYFSILILLGTMLLLLWQSGPAAAAVREGLALCAHVVIPALFPFLVLSGLFLALGYGEALNPLLRPVMGRLFHADGLAGGVFFLGILGGYPVGARMIGQLYREGRCGRQEAEYLLSFCNNAGPAFVLGMVGLGRFGDLRPGLYLYGLHVFSAILVGILLRPKEKPSARSLPAPPPPHSFAPALIGAVQSAFSGILQVCGFVIFSLVILQLLTLFLPWQHPLLTGFVELTCGILQLTGNQQGFLLAAALLGWGGLSVLGQTAAMLADTDLSLRPYLQGKSLQAVLSLLLALPVSFFLP